MYVTIVVAGAKREKDENRMIQGIKDRDLDFINMLLDKSIHPKVMNVSKHHYILRNFFNFKFTNRSKSKKTLFFETLFGILPQQVDFLKLQVTKSNYISKPLRLELGKFGINCTC